MANEKSCGVIIFTTVNNVRKYVIVRGVGIYQKYCGFPAGHMEPGETEQETALREVKEETGLDVVLLDGFRTVDEHFLAREGRPNDKKTNVYFLAEFHDQELVAQKSEVSEIALMDYEEALNSFEYEGSKRELTEAEEYLNKLAASGAVGGYQMDFNGFVKDIRDNQWNVFGVEVYEDGVLTHSYGDTEENLHEVYSVTKSILSIAFGIAWDRGLIDPGRSVLSYMPAEKVAKLSEKQKETWETITIHRLLCMSVGDLPFRAEGESWLDFALSCPISNPQERTFNYSNINAYLVGVALTEVLGTDLGVFIEENIFAPLGITRFAYGRCPEGYFYGASRTRLTVHDFSKIGLMLYNGGVYEGKRILSEEYIRMATSSQQACREGGYGYFFWRYMDGFSMNGRLKQKCYILPSRKLIVTHLAEIEDTSPALKDSLEAHIMGL